MNTFLLRIENWLQKYFPWLGTIHPAVMMIGGLILGMILSRLIHHFSR